MISLAHLGGTMTPYWSGFCSVDPARGNLRQKQKEAALLQEAGEKSGRKLPTVLGWEGGGGFEFVTRQA